MHSERILYTPSQPVQVGSIARQQSGAVADDAGPPSSSEPWQRRHPPELGHAPRPHGNVGIDGGHWISPWPDP